MDKLEQILKNTDEIKQGITLLSVSGDTGGDTDIPTGLGTKEEEKKEDKPNKDETHPKINLRLKKELKEKLDDIAAENGMHTATYVRTLCYMAITNAANLQLKDLNLKSELKKMEAEFI